MERSIDRLLLLRNELNGALEQHAAATDSLARALRAGDLDSICAAARALLGTTARLSEARTQYEETARELQCQIAHLKTFFDIARRPTA